MSKSKLLKYEVINTKKDKKLIGEVFDFKKVKAKGGPTTKPRAKTPAWFIEFRDEQREFNKSVMQKFDKQEEFNMRIEKEVSNLRSDFDRVIKLNNLKH